MHIARYRINLDALLARIIYRWRFRSLTVVLLVIVLIGLGSGLIPPFWNGRAVLEITAAPDATIQIDGRSWPRTVYAGRHTLLATRPDGRGSWADFDLPAGQMLTLTLPPGLPEPRERSLPPAAPGTYIDQVYWADGAWRVTSVHDRLAEVDEQGGQAYGPTPTTVPGQTVAVSPSGMERLATLDAYAGLADQVHVTDQLIEAVYRLNSTRGFSDQALGTIEVRGWSEATQTVPISAPLTLLRLSTDGATLLTAEQVPGGGEQVYLVTQDTTRVPVVAVPGHITRLSWRPDGSAVVIHSMEGERLTLTLARIRPTVIAAVIADLPASDYAASLVPLTWNNTGLLWVAPDREDVSTLWHTPLQSLIPERKRPMDARALTSLPDGTLRAVTIQGGDVVIGRYQGDIFIGETTVPGIPAVADLMGMWQGNELLLQSGERAWLLDVQEEEN
jgi:uncharacterized protein YjeT (DUF2065 family)